nr:uncharacterized protein LOC110376815 [Helicoverpa armigera]
MSTDNILLLPIDVLVNIFKKLKLSDLRNVMLTCKTFHNLIKHDNTIWRPHCRNKLMILNRSSAQDLWYNRCRTSHNWCKGFYKTKMIVHHYTNYMPWLIFPNSEVLVVSMGSELYSYATNKYGTLNYKEDLWKLEVPKIKRSDVRTNDISRFVLRNNFMVCGNRDGCTAIYKVNNIRRRPWLQYHIQDCHDNGNVEVSAVELIDGRNQLMLITGSTQCASIQFCSLRKDNSENKTFIHKGSDLNVLNISVYKNAGTKCMALNNGADKLAIGLNGNSKPLVLDVNSPRFLVTADATNNRKQAVRDIQWHDENTIVYVTHSGLLEMIDIRTKEMIYSTRDPFQSTLYCVKSDGHNAIVVGSAEYSRCVLFDSRNQNNHVQMYFTQRRTSPVYSLEFDAHQLVTAVDRGVGTLNFNLIIPTERQKDYSHVFF